MRRALGGVEVIYDLHPRELLRSIKPQHSDETHHPSLEAKRPLSSSQTGSTHHSPVRPLRRPPVFGPPSSPEDFLRFWTPPTLQQRVEDFLRKSHTFSDDSACHIFFNQIHRDYKSLYIVLTIYIYVYKYNLCLGHLPLFDALHR